MGRNSIDFKYGIEGDWLKNEVRENDLGIIINNDLKSHEQCTEAISKANKILNIMGRRGRI